MKFHDIWENICAHYGLDPKQIKVEFQYETQEEVENRLDISEKALIDSVVNGTELPESTPAPYGRTVECRIVEDGKVIVRQQSHCNPIDNFVKREGRRVAFGKAYKDLKEVKGLGQTIAS